MGFVGPQSAVGIGFNGAETNCGIAHILGILLMNSCNTVSIFLATAIICSLSTLKYIYQRESGGYKFHALTYMFAALHRMSRVEFVWLEHFAPL